MIANTLNILREDDGVLRVEFTAATVRDAFSAVESISAYLNAIRERTQKPVVLPDSGPAEKKSPEVKPATIADTLDVKPGDLLVSTTGNELVLLVVSVDSVDRETVRGQSLFFSTLEPFRTIWDAASFRVVDRGYSFPGKYRLPANVDPSASPLDTIGDKPNEIDPRLGQSLGRHCDVRKGDVWRTESGLTILALESDVGFNPRVDSLSDESPAESKARFLAKSDTLIATGIRAGEFAKGVKEGRWKE